jgi:hypothetical protein
VVEAAPDFDSVKHATLSSALQPVPNMPGIAWALGLALTAC